MKKRLFILASIALVVGFGLMIMPGSWIEAMGCRGCMPGGITPVTWGHGSTCQAAISDAQQNAFALIPGSCDVCGVDYVFQAPCTDACDKPGQCFNQPGHANEWQVDAKAVYDCHEDFCIP